jgi:hypothetical protein
MRGLDYSHERFFIYLKERTVVFHHKMGAKDYIQGITNLKQFLTLLSSRKGEVSKRLIWTLSRIQKTTFNNKG